MSRLENSVGSSGSGPDGDPQKIFRNWPDFKSLPALSAVASEIVDLTSTEPFDWERTIRLFETDAGLSAKLLRLVNSSYYGLRRSIANVDRAARMLGEVTFRCLALGLAVASSLPRPKFKPFDPDLYWRDNLIRALFAKELATVSGSEHKDEVFSAALLQKLALPLMVLSLGDDYRKMLQAREERRVPLRDFEKEYYGWDHARLGAWVAEKWGFPLPMVHAIRQQYEPVRMARADEGDGRLVPWTQLSAQLPSTAYEDPTLWSMAFRNVLTFLPTLPLDKVAGNVDLSFEELANLFQESDAKVWRLADRVETFLQQTRG